MVWTILQAVAPALPYGLGAFITVAAILVAVSDIQSTRTGPAIIGAIVTMLLAILVNDQSTTALYLLAAIFGIMALSHKSHRAGVL